jgi:hypothetical protein
MSSGTGPLVIVGGGMRWGRWYSWLLGGLLRGWSWCSGDVYPVGTRRNRSGRDVTKARTWPGSQSAEGSAGRGVGDRIERGELATGGGHCGHVVHIKKGLVLDAGAVLLAGTGATCQNLTLIGEILFV